MEKILTPAQFDHYASGGNDIQMTLSKKKTAELIKIAEELKYPL